jgi:predicted Ser/Thr protein kinase
LAEGVTVPGVEYVSELGRGARTVVYRARRGDREYAVKVLRTVGGRDEALAFRREAALLAGLDHPDLPDVHDVGEADGHPYLIMDLVVGRPLAAVLRAEQRLDETRTATLGAEVADAPAVAHRAGLVHRDVKPDNIMIGPDGRARVIDFGFATRTGSEVADAAVGTFAYSAPEQTGMLRRPVDGRADLYALGVVLFECLTGEPPFRAGDAGELIQMHLAVPAPDVRGVRPDVSAALAAVVDALLAKDPDDRYQSGDGLRADLLRVAGGQREAFALGTSVTRTADDGELVGRDDERTRLLARWRQVVDGMGGGLVLVQGASGTGKSRLVRESTAAVAASGGTVLHGAYGADEALPLAPVRSAIDGHVQAAARLDGPARQVAEERPRAAAADVAGLLRPLSEGLGRLLPGPEAAVSDDPYRFVDALAAFLVKLADGAGGAVLHLDDAQWFDDDTLRVVGRLVPLLADSRLLLVVTARDDAESRPAVEHPGGVGHHGPDRPPQPRAVVASMIQRSCGFSACRSILDVSCAASTATIVINSMAHT